MLPAVDIATPGNETSHLEQRPFTATVVSPTPTTTNTGMVDASLDDDPTQSPPPLQEVAPVPIVASATAAVTKQSMGMWALAALTFFGVSGGPYGAEELVSSGGPMMTILVICIVPWIWCFPMALMTAELATTMPEMGGYIVWVDRAFGPFWAFQNGIWKVACNIVDNSLYPYLFVYYLMSLTGELTYGTRLLVSYSLVFVVCALNILGVDVVSDASFVLMVFTLLPFLALVIVGLARGEVDPGDWSHGPPEGKTMTYGTFLTIALWKTSGYDNAGTCASEVKNPSKAFPRAMLISVILVTLVYLLPIMVGVSYAKDYEKWADGYFVQVAKLTAGSDWLGVWVTVTGSLTSLAMLNTTICTNARAIQCMASLGFFPQSLARINKRFKTPDVAVMVNGFIVCLVLLPDMDFAEIANVSMWFYALTIFILFAAFLRLRVTHAYLPRPYKIPLSFWPLTFFVALPPCVCCLLLMIASHQSTWLIGIAVCTLTFVLWFPHRWYVHRYIVRVTPPLLDENGLPLDRVDRRATSATTRQEADIEMSTVKTPVMKTKLTTANAKPINISGINSNMKLPLNVSSNNNGNAGHSGSGGGGATGNVMIV